MSERHKERGYSKLEGKNWSICISQLKFLIGRNTKNQQNADLHLGNSTLISRKHAKIQYDFNQYRFTIKCLSRNGIKINGQLFRRHHGAIKLESKDNIQVGPSEFTFLLPFKTAKRHEKQKSQRETRTAKRKRSNSTTTTTPPPSKRVKVETPPPTPQVASVAAVASVVPPPPTPAEPVIVPIPQQKKPKEKENEGPNPHKRPNLSFAQLITQAITSDTEQQKSFAQICQYICDKHPYYKFAGKSWKSTVRHVLSVNKKFYTVKRPDSKEGRGGYWRVVPDDNKTSPPEATNEKPPPPEKKPSIF